MSAVLKSELEQEVERYSTWRDELLHAVDGYRDWLEKNGELDAQHSLRFYELCESIRQGRLSLAFVGRPSIAMTEQWLAESNRPLCPLCPLRPLW